MPINNPYSSIFDEVIADLRVKSRSRIYQDDFEAWSSDVLGMRHYEKMRGFSEDFLHSGKQRTAIKSSNGAGKDIAVDTKIPTPTGWTTMGELSVGDLVYDENGAPTRVVWKSEVFNTPSYRVIFNDGSSIVTSATHQWNTMDLNRRSTMRTKDWRNHWDATSVVTTEEISQSLTRGIGAQANHAIPISGPLHMERVGKQLLDPYVLGAWLGDGTSQSAQMTIGNDGLYIVDEFRKSGVELWKLKAQYLYSFSTGNGGYKDTLRRVGVLHNKHIPPEYKTGSIFERKELLRGLLDTDGFVAGNGLHVGIDLANLRLAEDLVELVRSLGIRISMHTSQNKDGFTRHRMLFSPNFNPFTVDSYKYNGFTPGAGQPSRQTIRAIVSVEEIESVPTQCIQVDSERHLYLATEWLIPTHNSLWLAHHITHWVTAFPPEESLAIVSAPTLFQVENVIFRYLKTIYGDVKVRAEELHKPFPFPGEINESLEWRYIGPGGKMPLVLGKRPSDTDIVSTFQGIRATGENSRTLVALDEGGGIPKDLYTAAEAVMTSKNSKQITIGNPDRRATEFHRIFTVEALMQEYNLGTISAYDLPTMTGEIVYPDDPAKQRQMLKGLTSREWIEHKERVWKVGGNWDARGLSKVLGEFPGETDNTFFPQAAIDMSHDKDIDGSGSPMILGCDVAAMGDDESVVYTNRGGRVRLFKKEITYDDGGEKRKTTGVWSKEDEVSSARRIHAIAMYLGADEVRVDAAGLGGGIFRMLERLDEFDDKCYTLFAIQGANISLDRDRWNRRKEQNYDSLRRQMVDGLIDIDPEDAELRDELLLITFAHDTRGAVKMTPKKQMRNVIGGSPDRVDALVYATCDVSELFGPQPGDIVGYDADDLIGNNHPFYNVMSDLGW